MRKVYTIGHSSHQPEHFLSLLQQHGMQVLVDTRSAPYSKYSPQFDRETLRDQMTAGGVKYLYLGDVVGGRPKDKAHYDDKGRALYGKIAESAEFLAGIARLERGADEFKVALLCSEEDPGHCHRRLLIGRVLVERGAQLLHIRGKGELQDETEVTRLSGKDLAETQPALFEELDEDQWRSSCQQTNRYFSSTVTQMFTQHGLDRYEGKQAKINAWEELQKSQAEAEMKKTQAKVERILFEAGEKMNGKVASAAMKAVEMRAAAEANRDEQNAKASARADLIRKTGIFSPPRRSFTSCLFS